MSSNWEWTCLDSSGKHAYLPHRCKHLWVHQCCCGRSSCPSVCSAAFWSWCHLSTWPRCWVGPSSRILEPMECDAYGLRPRHSCPTGKTITIWFSILSVYHHKTSRHWEKSDFSLCRYGLAEWADTVCLWSASGTKTAARRCRRSPTQPHRCESPADRTWCLWRWWFCRSRRCLCWRAT